MIFGENAHSMLQQAQGEVDAANNLLVNAPHSVHALTAESWDHPYSRESAFFPMVEVREDKFWPPVGRIDNVFGDKNLACACPPMEAYSEAAD